MVGPLAQGRAGSGRPVAASAGVDAGTRGARHLLRRAAGRWIAEDEWPPRSTSPWPLALSADGALTGGTVVPGELRIIGDQRCGETQGVWCANGMRDELPDDQRADDERSLTFDTPPLEKRVELLGYPELALNSRRTTACGLSAR